MEILLTIAGLIFLALLVASLPPAISSITKSRHTSIAKDVALERVEVLRKTVFLNLANGSYDFTSTDLNKLPSPQASYQIDDCLPAICTQGENAKQIKVTVAWQEGPSSQKVELTTLLSEGGLGQ